jgi:2'-5' RNA ligase
VRLFLAVDPPAATRERLRGLIARLSAAPSGWRFVRAEGIHLTLRFLGEVPAERDAALRPAFREVARATPPFRLRAAGLAAFPHRRRPRVLVVPLAGEPPARLEQLAHDVEQAARAAGFAAETRRFRPHWTLARAVRGGRAALPQDAGLADETIAVVELLLVESTLGPSGARYTVRDVYPLGPGPVEGA